MAQGNNGAAKMLHIARLATGCEWDDENCTHMVGVMIHACREKKNYISNALAPNKRICIITPRPISEHTLVVKLLPKGLSSPKKKGKKKRAACVLIVFLQIDSFNLFTVLAIAWSPNVNIMQMEKEKRNRENDIRELKLAEYLGIVTHES